MRLSPKKLIKGKAHKKDVIRKCNIKTQAEIRRVAKKKVQHWESVSHDEVRRRSLILLQTLNDRESFAQRGKAKKIGSVVDVFFLFSMPFKSVHKVVKSR